jgi:DNA-directed RNA polymerase specialized sigma24 family protein
VGHVTSAEVAAYRPKVGILALMFKGWNGAEVDDLEQEGLIAVWQSLARGVTPTETFITNRMRDWVRWLKRQTPIPYQAMLPLDDYRDIPAR